MRIPIPKNPEELIKLAKAVRDKHVALGTASPLNTIDGIAGFDALVDTADSSHTDAMGFAKQAETATEARDNALGPDTITPGTVRFYCDRLARPAGGAVQGQRAQAGRLGLHRGCVVAAHRRSRKPRSKPPKRR